MNREGIYRFLDDSPPQYLLYLDEDKKWVKTHKKVTPTTDMIIIYDDIIWE